MKKELQGLEKSPESEIHQESSKAKRKKTPNWKPSGHDGIYGIWSKRFVFPLALQLSKCMEEAIILEWMTKEETILIQKDPTNKNPSPATIDQ